MSIAGGGGVTSGPDPPHAVNVESDAAIATSAALPMTPGRENEDLEGRLRIGSFVSVTAGVVSLRRLAAWIDRESDLPSDA